MSAGDVQAALAAINDQLQALSKVKAYATMTWGYDVARQKFGRWVNRTSAAIKRHISADEARAFRRTVGRWTSLSVNVEAAEGFLVALYEEIKEYPAGISEQTDFASLSCTSQAEVDGGHERTAEVQGHLSHDDCVHSLRALREQVRHILHATDVTYLDANLYASVFRTYRVLVKRLCELHPSSPYEFADAITPAIRDTTSGKKIHREDMTALLANLIYTVDLSGIDNRGRKSGEHLVFISHGRDPIWREVQSFIENDCGINTLDLEQQPYEGRTNIEKLLGEAAKCSFAVIVMTGEDKTENGEPRARENVIHEIGLFQGLFGRNAVCIVYEEGTSIPSNLDGVGYCPLTPSSIGDALVKLRRELEAYYGHNKETE